MLVTASLPAGIRLACSFVLAGALCILAGCSHPQPHALKVVRTAPEEVPFEVEDGLPVVPCRVNGRDARLLLDTGSDAVALFEGRAARFEVRSAGQRPGKSYTAAGNTTHPVGSDFTLQLGTRTEIRVTCPNLYPAGTWLADGILPVTVLTQLHATVDIKRRVLILCGPK
jgi:hypothetical protein